MNNNKVIFIDYDGTLYNRTNNGIYEEVYDLLKKCKGQNIDIYLTTGRTMPYLFNDSKLLSMINGVIGANGSFLYENGIYAFDNFICFEDVLDIYNYTNINNLSTVYFHRDGCYASFKDIEQFEKFKYYNPMPTEVLTNINQIKKDIELICIYAPVDLIDPMIPVFTNLLIYKWGSSGADVVSKNVSKGKAIKKLIEEKGYKVNNTYAIGDGLNDIEMFNEVNTSIAMGNASDFVKSHAKVITSSIFDRGVEKILLEILNEKM
jgi:Cof subfamily protein (haloacid dehalogenase superfamily)